ncbi:Hypothetical protein Minf_0395 [Methylacidiphilum infernorum V4]|uniref:Uncharacterized protein n=1 Tax=Methylacidiphilum infernorum (isolate V4) TaxID=481448 RepID=B3DYT1_METI4|nr:Hypothetical protein Minf_0395 [Methylacidiphilum infernorum V4]
MHAQPGCNPQSFGKTRTSLWISLNNNKYAFFSRGRLLLYILCSHELLLSQFEDLFFSSPFSRKQ